MPRDPEKLQAWRIEHREQMNANTRASNARHPDKVRARNKAYKAAHRDELNAKRRQHHTENREHENNVSRAWKQAHPEEVAVYAETHKEESNARQRRYYVNNQEKVLQRAKEYREEHREEINAASREAHPIKADKRNASSKAWRESHPAHVKKYQRQYRTTHLDEHKTYENTRRSRKANAPINDLTPAQWVMIKEHYKHCCVYCGKKFQRLTQDHIVPLSKGGSHTLSNVVPACKSCNSKKGNRAPLSPVQPLLL
mgnify:CR=1 FL=1